MLLSYLLQEKKETKMTDLKDKVFNLLTFINTWYDKNPDSTILTNAGTHTFFLQRKTFNLDLSYQNGLLKYLSEVLKNEKQYYAGQCVNVGEKAGVGEDTAYFTVAISINHELVQFDAEVKDNLLTIFI